MTGGCKWINHEVSHITLYLCLPASFRSVERIVWIFTNFGPGNYCVVWTWNICTVLVNRHNVRQIYFIYTTVTILNNYYSNLANLPTLVQCSGYFVVTRPIVKYGLIWLAELVTIARLYPWFWTVLLNRLTKTIYNTTCKVQQCKWPK